MSLTVMKAKKILRDDISYYAKDSRLTEPADNIRYDWRSAINHFKQKGSMLTEEEFNRYRIR